MSVSLLNLLLDTRASDAKASLSITYGFISRGLYRVCVCVSEIRVKGDDNAPRKLLEGVSRFARTEDIIRGSNAIQIGGFEDARIKVPKEVEKLRI